MATDCVFCKIVTNDIPAQRVLESDRSLAFWDNEPQAPKHMLVVPKTHVENADDLGQEHAELLADLFATSHKAAVQEGLSPKAGGNGYRLVFNVGDDANNTVPHLHMHVLGGRLLTWPPG